MAVITGTPGNDTLISPNLGQTDELRGLGGNDTLIGDADVDYLKGGDGNDSLIGNDEGDQLDGGIGADIMLGGNGNDSYTVDNINDVVIDSDSWGNIYTSVNYTTVGTLTLHLTASGITGTGNAQNNFIRTTNSSVTNNTLLGLDGDDLLRAGANSTLNGGNGDDNLGVASGTGTLIGGQGNDTYDISVTPVNLVINESAAASGGGIDTIFTTVDNFSLVSMTGVTYTGGNFIENLTLAAPGASQGQILGPITATGNGLDNTIIGNRQNNIISALNGNDFVYGSFGDDSIDGGQGNDQLFGEAGNDTLIGGVGSDQLWGGFGNDVYSVDNIADLVFEFSGQGTDTVNTSVSWQTSAEVEIINTTTTASVRIELLNSVGTQININTSSFQNDTLIGGSGNDTLGGRAGQDTLTGGLGADNFVFGGTGLVPSGSGTTSIRNDVITDFLSGTDRIVLHTATFTTPNPLQTTDPLFLANVPNGTNIDQTNAYFVFRQDTSQLYYNSNLTAFGTEGIFATLSGVATLTTNDFLITS